MMKKYLMTGMAAVALSAAFTSCSNNEVFDPDRSQTADQVTMAYNQAFVKTFGQPAANQDWGFGTRANTRTANKNLNEWGDPEKGNWVVPDPLTEGQKTRVMAYFQANPGLTYEDPKLTNFFVQQVYKGNPATKGAISSEEYTQTNGDKITGSDNMDWLYAGTNNDHINDYNNGTWNNGYTKDVLNTGEKVGGKTHPDMITLMENSSTEYIAFGSSTGNQYHTNCCALAGWQVIEAWAIAHKDSLEAIGKFGETLDDSWNRSFVGLDYENKTLDNLYSSKGNAKALDFKDGNSQYILYKGKVLSAGEFVDFELKNTRGENVRYVVDNVANQAIADYIKYDRNNNGNLENVTKDAYNYKWTKDQFKAKGITIQNGEAGLYDLDMIMGYIRQSALPTDNNGNWVKNIGGRDYVFSDWIVTLTEAKQQQNDTPTIPTPDYTIRVIGEDLSASDDTDFDFNDVVFDVALDINGKTWIRLQAAGGTLPLIIGEKNPANDQEYTAKEVHNLFGGYSTSTMINTNASAHGKAADGVAPVEIELDQAYSSAKDIPVYVKKNGTWVELTAEQGQPASKIGVDTTFQWVNERVDLKGQYPRFVKWVTENTEDVSVWY